ncbi:MAG: sensor histidine kinase [Clostridia bacterium]|nr:sensor histidine kinase [Clostridia bacterium]
MEELSLHILDILENAREAGATKILLWIRESRQEDVLKFKIIDNGRGMGKEMLQKACDPFATTRRTRKVGLGLAMLKATAEACGGGLRLVSCPGKGTRVEASFQYSHVDRPPMGNLAGSIGVFLVGTQSIHLRYIHRKNGKRFVFDSKAFLKQAGGLSFQEPRLFALLLNSLEIEDKD